MDGSSDPFFEQFYTRVPAEVASTFSTAQLNAIRLAYGARTRGAHGVEIRKSFPFLWMRLYIVLLMGRERRDRDRLSREGGLLGFVGEAFVTLLVWGLFILPWAVVLYAVKSALGIDLVHGGGAHSIWADIVRQFSILFS